jgi:hypothetical protein
MVFSFSTLAQGWRGVQPGGSSCKDIERFFGTDACSKKSVSQIFPDESVTVVFASGGCDSKSPNQRYDVRVGTVTDILVIPRHPRRLLVSDLNVDKSRFKKKPAGDFFGVFEYTSLELGMKFTASKKGQVLDIAYFPSAKYDNLRCSSAATKVHAYFETARE